MLQCIFYKKKLWGKYLGWFAHGEPYIPYDTMIEKLIGSTFSYNNVHEVLDNNNNPYRRMVMDIIRMNQGYASECSIVDEPNINTTRFFKLLKYFDEPL